MIPVLYDGGAVDPRRLGKGKLPDVISCVVHEELNGDFSMTLQYPITGVHYDEMTIGSSIVVVMPCFNATNYHSQIPVSSESGTKRDIQVFDIYKKSTPIDGVVTFYCQSIAWRLKDCVYYKKTWLGGGSCKEILKDSVPVTVYSTYKIELNGAGFEVITPFIDAGQTPTYTNSVPKSTLAMFLGEEESVVSTMGWDIAFTSRVNTSDPNTPAFVSQIYALKYGRGDDYGVIIRHGYRLTNVEYTDDSTDTFNAVVPYWDDGNGAKTYVTGYVVQPTTPITPIKAVPMDCTDAFDTQPTGAQLAEYAQDWLDTNTPWVNVKNITLDFINGSEISGVNATINLGDTVRVYWPAADINIKLRAIAYDYDILAERYNSIELGKQQENFVSVTGIDGGSGASGGVTEQPMKTDLLWENPSPSSSFAAQTVPLDLTPYKYIIIVATATSSDVNGGFAFGRVGDGIQYNIALRNYNTSVTYAYVRRFEVTTTGITFETGIRDTTEGTGYAIPKAIYGVRL